MKSISRKPHSIQTIALVVAGLGLGIVTYQLRSSLPRTLPFASPTPNPQWREQEIQLSSIEEATMSGNFTKEFQQAQAEEHITPKPLPLFALDVPASMAGDIQAPTVTISGGPSEGTTIAYTNPCFPLWVNDNITPWQQLVTRSKLDIQQWGPWMNYFSYCVNNLSDGSHTIRIQIKDLAGNVSSEIKRTFIVKQ